MKIQKKILYCIYKICENSKKKKFGGVRVDVNEEFKILGKLKKKQNWGGGGGSGWM